MSVHGDKVTAMAALNSKVLMLDLLTSSLTNRYSSETGTKYRKKQICVVSKAKFS